MTSTPYMGIVYDFIGQRSGYYSGSVKRPSQTGKTSERPPLLVNVLGVEVMRICSVEFDALAHLFL